MTMREIKTFEWTCDYSGCTEKIRKEGNDPPADWTRTLRFCDRIDCPGHDVWFCPEHTVPGDPHAR